MADEGYQQASADQKLNIATYFIMSSPTGEVDEVVRDVRKLINDDSVLSDGAITKILADYNTDQLVSGPDPDGQPCIVSVHGQIDQSTFVDPSTGRIMKFDHKRRKFVEVTDKKQVLDENVQKYRTAIEKEMVKYIEVNYKANKAVYAVYGADNGTITVAISGANVHLGNFWTGGWRSTYQFSVAAQGSVDVKCDIKTQVHYFEDGNVQLHAKFPTKTTVAVSNEAKTAAAIVAAIKQVETDFQSHLELMYIDMHTNTFKHMRKFWPVNKQPMNWSLAAHKMSQELGASG